MLLGAFPGAWLMGRRLARQIVRACCSVALQCSTWRHQKQMLAVKVAWILLERTKRQADISGGKQMVSAVQGYSQQGTVISLRMIWQPAVQLTVHS